MALIDDFKGLIFFFYPYDVIYGERLHVHVSKGRGGHRSSGKIFIDGLVWDYTGDLTRTDMKNAEEFIKSAKGQKAINKKIKEIKENAK
jgi:hypothetical protein